MRYPRHVLATQLILSLAIISAGPSLLAQTATHVVISEVYGGGGNSGAMWKNDFVELYNPTSTPVSLNGWSVQYASATGSTWSVTTLTGSIPAFGFYLVQEAIGAGGTMDLPTPDATGTIAMSATAGKLALVNSTTALSGTNPSDPSAIDLLGYGTTASAFEGSGRAPAPSNTTSVERKARSSSDSTKLASGGVDQFAGNGGDSNNNASDFVKQSTVLPQNSSSEIEGLRVHNPTTDAYFGKIQRAIDQASSSQTLDVAAGTYSETISLTKDLTIISSGVPSIIGDITVNSGVSITLNANVSVQGNIVVESEAMLADGGSGKVIATGSSSIDQGGSFSAPLDVETGTTTASGANSFDGNITVLTDATLNIPASKFLRATGSVTINSGATVSGPGTLCYAAPDQYFTNAGTISAPAVFEGTNYQYTYLDGDGTWTSLTINDSVYVDLQSSTFLTNSNITLNSRLRTLSYVLNLNSGTLQVNSKGAVTGGAHTVETQGTVSVLQHGSFSEPFEVLGGVTTAHGVFSGDVAVDDGATLGIPSGDTLTAAQNVTVNGGSTGGTIAGPGHLLLTGNGKTFSNDGLVSAPATFVDNDGDKKIVTGSGSWTFLTIPPGEGADNRGTMYLVGSPVPLTVSGTIIDTAGSFVYKGTSSQTVAPLTYRMLTIDNPAGVVLSGAATVNNTLTMTSGSLTTGADTLKLGDSATLTEGASSAVRGNLTTTRACLTGVNQTFGGMGLEINASGAVPGTTTVTRVTGTAPTFPPGIPIKRYFDIQPTTNSGLNATFVFHYATNELNGNDESGLSLYRSTDGGTNWSSHGGTANTTAHTVTLATVNAFSRWTAGGVLGNLPPAVASLVPSTVALGETTTVTLTGVDFIDGASSPEFGSGILVNSFTVVSSTEMSINITVSATASVGERNVSVTTEGPGGGTATLTNGLTLVYPSPSLAGIAPNIASRGETLNLTLTGKGYYSAVTTVGLGADITVNSVAILGTTEIAANITVGASAVTGARGVTVTNAGPGGGSTTLESALTIGNPAPTLAGITPASGSRGQTLDVTVMGSNFLVGVTTCSHGDGIMVNSVSSITPTQVTASVTIDLRAATGSRDVTVTNAGPGGGSAALAGAFSVTNPVPTVSGVSPNQTGKGSKLNLVLTGTNFLEGVSTVSFGPDITVNSTNITSSTQITVDISVSASAVTGARNVTVTNAAPGGGSASIAGGFTVDSSPAAGVESLLGVMPNEFVLHEAYPNPFNPVTRIRYGLPERSRVKLEVYNMLGNIVAALVDGERSKGFYEVEWVAGNLPSGVYLIRLQAESLESSKRLLGSRKVVLVK